MQTPLISVIIPVYNVEAYLPRCLDSVIQNTYRNLEIICVDDGSTDGSPEILRDYAQRDARITLITKENGGVSSARNAGLDRATGEFVAFIDSDDFVHPQYFELLLRAKEETGADMVAVNYLPVEENLSVIYNKYLQGQEYVCEASVDRSTFFMRGELRNYCCGKLIASRCIHGLRFNETFSYGEDSIFLAELWEKNDGLICCFLNEKLYYYYSRAGSLANSVKGENRMNLAGYLLKRAALSKNNETIYLGQAEFRLLWYLKYYLFTEPDRTVVKECLRLMRSGLPLVLKSDIFSNREKAYYLFKCFFPRVRSLKTMLKQ